MINSIQNRRLNTPSFKGGFDFATQALTFLSTNQAIGATLVDVSSMSLPRTYIDFTHRGKEAGTETAIREFSTSLNTVAIGVVGSIVAMLISGVFNKNYGIKAHQVFINSEMIDKLGETWHGIVHGKDSIRREKYLKTYFDRVLDDLEGFNPQFKNSEIASEAWVKLDKSVKDKACQMLCALNNDKTIGHRLPDDKLNYLKNLIISATGAETDFKLGDVKLSLTAFLNTTFGMGKAFSTERISNLFENAKDYGKNDFINNLKKLKMRSSLAALALSGLIGLSIQPLNRYLTKKRTGQDGFVGVKNKKADKSPGFLMQKVAASMTMFTIAMSSIDMNAVKKFDFKAIANKIQFLGKIPILAQYKFLYGITIVSRFMSSRDKNELRESFTRDLMGFASWLILGGIAEKGVAIMLDKEHLLKVDVSKGKSGFITWLFRSSVKSRNEIVQSAMRKYGLETVTADGRALKLGEMLEQLKKINPEAFKKINGRVRGLNIAQLGGYLYSGLLLGIFIPRYNIYMTKRLNKDKAPAAAVAETKSDASKTGETNLLKKLAT